MPQDRSNELDVAIIGAGVSGLYAGWRLRTESSPPDVTLFEMSDRIGGRLYTVQNFADTGMHAELGGMRYMTHQKIVDCMIRHFGLEHELFPMGDPKHNLYYLRRAKFKAGDWGADAYTPYYNVSDYSRDDRGKLLDADAIFGKIVGCVLAANCVEKPDDRKGWDEIKPTLKCTVGPDEGKRLEDVGFWNLIQGMVDSESYKLVAQAGGYYSNTINWNAAEALPYVTGDFSGQTEYRTLKRGMDAIALELHRKFLASGGEVKKERRLLRFEIREDEEYRYDLIMLEDGGKAHYYAKHLIMGMPRRSLELIRWPEVLWREMQFRVRSVIGDPSFKLLMAFDHPDHEQPWWQREFGLGSGRALTDLPMRQCYYFGTKNRRSILLASYNDMRTVAFWKTLEGPHAGHIHLTEAVSGLRDSQSAEDEEKFEPNWEVLGDKNKLQSTLQDVEQAPQSMVAHSMEQLREIHNYDDIPEPCFTAYQNWNHDPYGGGYHAWKARFNIEFEMKYMRKPFQKESIHIVGEAYSDQQGWVEGAFCTTELMLEESFRLSRPQWLDPNYYLGR